MGIWIGGRRRKPRSTEAGPREPQSGRSTGREPCRSSGPGIDTTKHATAAGRASRGGASEGGRGEREESEEHEVAVAVRSCFRRTNCLHHKTNQSTDE